MPIVFASDEFRINTTDFSQQNEAAAVSLAGGGYVVAWRSLSADGAEGYDIYYTVFSDAGAALTGELRANVTIPGTQQHVAVAALADGGFVLAWDGPGTGTDSFARVFSAAGAPAAGEMRLNTFTTSEQTFPAVAGLDGGGWVAVWQSLGQVQFGRAIVGRTFGDNGQADVEFIVNTTEGTFPERPVVAGLADGGFVVGWVSSFQDGSGDGIYAQRFDSAGALVGAEFRINSTTAGNQSDPALVALPDGGFLFAWSSQNVDGSGTAVMTQRFDAAGASAGAEVQVNTTATGDQGHPQLALLGNGGYVVTWETTVPGSGLNAGIFAQMYNANGTRNGGETRLDVFGALTQELPVAATTADGFAAAWQTFGQGQGYDLFGRVFDVQPTAPVFRFYNEATGAHFYTGGADERDVIIASFPTYHYEGVAFGAAHAVTDDTAPLWRFFNTVTKSHFWTISVEERDSVIENLPQYIIEGRAFDAYAVAAEGTVPVWRFYNTLSGTHFYTSGVEERDYIVEHLPTLTLEGIAYYVEPVYTA